MASYLNGKGVQTFLKQYFLNAIPDPKKKTFGQVLLLSRASVLSCDDISSEPRNRETSNTANTSGTYKFGVLLGSSPMALFNKEE